MKKEFGFILFDNINEFEKYLKNKQTTSASYEFAKLPYLEYYG